MLPEDAFDPMWQRIGISAVCLGFFGLSYLAPKFTQRHITTILYGILYLISIWLHQLIWKNDMRPEYTIALYVIVSASVLLFASRLSLLSYSIFTLFLGLIVTAMVNRPEVSPGYFIWMMVFLLIVSNISYGFVLKTFGDTQNTKNTIYNVAKTAFNASPEGILVIDQYGNILEFNQQFLDIWGFSESSLPLNDPEGCAKEAAKKLWQPKVFKDEATGKWVWPIQPEGQKLQLPLIKGKILQLQSRELPLGDKKTGHMLFFRDLTETLHVEKEKEQSRAIIDTTFALSGLGILVTGTDMQVLFHNDNYLKMWALDGDFLMKSDPQEVIEYCQRQLKPKTVSDEVHLAGAGKPFPSFYLNVEQDRDELLEMKDGRFLERSTRKMVINGETKGRVWYYRDITEKVKADEQLVHRNFELDTFVYRASHDLKAPLKSLSGLLSLAQDEFKGEKVSDFLAMMSQNVNRLEDIIFTLTDFSRNERMEVLSEPVDVAKILEEIGGKLRFMPGADDVKIILDNPDNLELISDGPRLSIILSNLISNSIKYASEPKDGAYVKISLERKGTDLQMSISDNGQGIPEGYQDRIFDLFFRGNAQSTGSGMGLYVARGTLLKLGGSIHLAPNYSPGAKFLITLPKVLPAAVSKTV